MNFPGHTRGLSIAGTSGLRLVPPPVHSRSVVLVSLRLRRLLLSRPAATALAATAASTCGHVLAAVHPAVSVPVGAAIAAHGVTLLLARLRALLLACRHLVSGMGRMTSMAGTALLLVLGMALVRFY